MFWFTLKKLQVCERLSACDKMTGERRQAAFWVEEMSKEIKLTKGKVAIVDNADYKWLNQWKWCAILTDRKTGGYALRSRWDPSAKRRGQVLMHRLIMGEPDGMLVDHINRNSLDNRRENLRITTYSGDRANRGMFKNNTSGYKGVSAEKKSGKWKMVVRKVFDTPEEAARAYDKCARVLFGEYASLNFPDDD